MKGAQRLFYLSILALSFGNTVFASSFTPTTCSPGDVTVPCEKAAWDVGFTGMYAQVFNDDMWDSRDAFLVQPNNTKNLAEIHDMKSDFGFAFNVQGSYHWADGNDLNVNWTHVDNSFNYDTSGLYNDRVIRILGAVSSKIISSSVKFKHDAVNVELGKTMHVGNRIDLRFHGGVQWARIDGSLDQSSMLFLNAAALPPSISAVINNRSKFDGIGPRAGVDASYSLGDHGLAFVARGAAALLVGETKTNFNLAWVAAPPLALGSVGLVSSQKQTSIIPEVNADLGAAYTHKTHNGDLSLEAGYRVAAFFHSVRWAVSSNIASIVVPVVSSSRPSNEVSTFGYQGPYATIKWLGNFA